MQVRTGADGIAHLQLASHQRIDLSLDEGSLDDPFWVSQRAGVSLVSRPGVNWTLDFPVVETGEIDGTVVLQRDDQQQPVSNVNLRLIDSNGKVVEEVNITFRPERWDNISPEALEITGKTKEVRWFLSILPRGSRKLYPAGGPRATPASATERLLRSRNRVGRR